MSDPTPSRVSLPALCVLVDEATCVGARRAPTHVAQAALAGGAMMLVWRAKGAPAGHVLTVAQALRALCARHDAALLVHDRVDVALALRQTPGAPVGVHLPASGLPTHQARALLGPEALLGRSCHHIEALREHADQGGSWATYSPIFLTDSKPGYGPALGLEALAAASAQVALPLYALGGMTPERASEALAHGASGVAVMGGICAADDPEGATARFVQALGRP